MRYLLERLADPTAAADAAAARQRLHQEVQAQIQRLVTVHLWPGSPGLELLQIQAPQLGGDLYATQADAQRLAWAVQDLVQRHEPRLCDVQVQVLGHAEPWNLCVQGRLLEIDAPTSMHIRFG